MEITDILPRSHALVKELAEGLNLGRCNFEQVEQQILQFVYELGQALEKEVLSVVREPTVENSVRVGERRALYSGMRNLRFRNRFGGTVVLPRRCYKFRDGQGGWSPLEEKLGLDRCLGYSPLMSYLLSSVGGSEAFARGGQLLSEVLGFSVSATAVQRNTEASRRTNPDNPYAMIVSTAGATSVRVDGGGGRRNDQPANPRKTGGPRSREPEATHGLERMQRGGHSEDPRGKRG